MYNLYKEDIKSYQLFIHWATSLLRGMTLLYVVAMRVIDRVWPGPPGALVSGGCPGCAPWRRTGRCGRTAPWPESPGPRGITGHCVVSEEEMLWRHSSQWTGETVREREKPVCRSHSSLTHPMPSRPAPVCHRRHLIGQALLTLVLYWPRESVTVRRHESMTLWSDRLKVNF